MITPLNFLNSFYSKSSSLNKTEFLKINLFKIFIKFSILSKLSIDKLDPILLK